MDSAEGLKTSADDGGTSPMGPLLTLPRRPVPYWPLRARGETGEPGREPCAHLCWDTFFLGTSALKYNKAYFEFYKVYFLGSMKVN